MLAVQQGQVFLGVLQSFWLGLVSFLPSVILAIILFIIGVVIANLIDKAVTHVINLTKVNTLLDKTALKEMTNKAGFRLNIGGLVGWLIKWLLILAFLIGAFNILGLSDVNVFLQQVVLFYLPRVIVAVLIVVLGSVLAEAAAKAVTGSARVANLSSANLAGTVAKWAIWVTTILFGLNQLGIGSDLIQTLWMGIVVAAALAFGLSFGLGGKEAAAKAIDHLSNAISRRNNSNM